MSKFTPGPWEISASPSGIIKSIGPLQADEYAGSAWLEVTPADAALIADATELLDALADLLNSEWQDDDGEPRLEEARDKARALIAKHRGGV